MITCALVPYEAGTIIMMHMLRVYLHPLQDLSQKKSIILPLCSDQQNYMYTANIICVSSRKNTSFNTSPVVLDTHRVTGRLKEP